MVVRTAAAALPYGPFRFISCAAAPPPFLTCCQVLQRSAGNVTPPVRGCQGLFDIFCRSPGKVCRKILQASWMPEALARAPLPTEGGLPGDGRLGERCPWSRYGKRFGRKRTGTAAGGGGRVFVEGTLFPEPLCAIDDGKRVKRGSPGCCGKDTAAPVRIGIFYTMTPGRSRRAKGLESQKFS